MQAENPQRDIAREVREFIAKNFYAANVEAISDDSSLLDQGIIDSTGVLELVAFLESTYAIHVEDEEIVPENLDSISAITVYVRRKRLAPAVEGDPPSSGIVA
ncbi:MAG TPA: acyl carrier protein [Polyangiaceae bacterium]|nr:acyl carrier protein [Polyangiaceae bacterium]